MFRPGCRPPAALAAAPASLASLLATLGVMRETKPV